MTIAGWLCVGVASAGLALASSPALTASAQDDGAFALGVLRRDGIVLPFAAFDGRRWSQPWPADLRPDLPISLADVPSRWWGRADAPDRFAHWSGGARVGEIAIDRPSTIPIMCSGRIVLRSDYSSQEPVPPPITQPFPKDGLAISGGQRIDAIPSVPRDSAEWKAAPAVLQTEFNRIEDAAAGNFYDWRHPVARQMRHRTPIEIEAMYRVPMDEGDWAAYYVEAVRQYPPGPEDEGCGLVTFVSGWLRLPEKGRPLFDLRGRVSYCHRRGVAYMLPLGTMRLDDKQFWIYQLSGADREWYLVTRPVRRGVEIHVEYPAGTCPLDPR